MARPRRRNKERCFLARVWQEREMEVVMGGGVVPCKWQELLPCPVLKRGRRKIGGEEKRGGLVVVEWLARVRGKGDGYGLHMCPKIGMANL
jgi:hypothetical protein